MGSRMKVMEADPHDKNDQGRKRLKIDDQNWSGNDRVDGASNLTTPLVNIDLDFPLLHLAPKFGMYFLLRREERMTCNAAAFFSRLSRRTQPKFLKRFSGPRRRRHRSSCSSSFWVIFWCILSLKMMNRVFFPRVHFVGYFLSCMTGRGGFTLKDATPNLLYG